MATIKSYTDVEQSRKLAEILPLESADGFWEYHDKWCSEGDEWEGYEDYPRAEPYSAFRRKENEWKEDKSDIPCWSLAALLNVLPNEIITDKSRFECHYQIDIRKYDGGDNTTLYQIAYGNSRGSSGSWHDMINTGERENLIDACADMIENLHKLKML